MLDIKVLKKLSTIYALIVEDDEMTAHALKQSLVMYCQRVEVAGNGMQGFEIFEDSKPDVVIADIHLPEMNGLEMVAAMHKISPHLPVIIITSYDNFENISESINQGAYSYLRKPIRIEELQTALLMATKDICNSHILLGKGFSYDCKKKLLFDPNQERVVLPKQERDFLHLLIANRNTIVEYSTIESYVWQEKSMSVETLRMCVQKIRKKTFHALIENISGFGYRINTPQE